METLKRAPPEQTQTQVCFIHAGFRERRGFEGQGCPKHPTGHPLETPEISLGCFCPTPGVSTGGSVAAATRPARAEAAVRPKRNTGRIKPAKRVCACIKAPTHPHTHTQKKELLRDLCPIWAVSAAAPELSHPTPAPARPRERCQRETPGPAPGLRLVRRGASRSSSFINVPRSLPQARTGEGRESHQEAGEIPPGSGWTGGIVGGAGARGEAGACLNPTHGSAAPRASRLERERQFSVEIGLFGGFC